MIGARWLLVQAAVLLAVAGCGWQGRFMERAPVANRSLSDDREPTMRVELARGPGYYLEDPATTRADGLGPGNTYMLIHAGHELPWITAWPGALSGSATGAERDQALAPQEQQLQFATPVVFHVLWDPFSPARSRPIVDNDYEFGARLAYRRGLGRRDVLHALPHWELRTGAYLGHISTHIGDEYEQHAQNRGVLPFPRINVSHEPWRADVGLRRTSADDTGHRDYSSYWSMMCRVEGASFHRRASHDLYYQVDPQELDGLPVSAIPDTPYGVDFFVAADAYNYVRQPENTFQRASRRRPAAWYVSASVGRLRVFAYDPTRPGAHDGYAPAFNVAGGYSPRASGEESIRSEPYVRVYVGPNPFGQLRNQRHFWLAGVGVRWRL